MANVTRLNIPYIYRKLVTAKEMYAQQLPSDEAVWAMCEYVEARMRRLDSCRHCAQYFDDPDYGRCTPGCYAMASEAYRVALAAQAKYPSANGSIAVSAENALTDQGDE